jgi:hypothetical protein
MVAASTWEQKCGVWTVHSEREGRPTLRGFAKSKADAEALLAKLKDDDADAAMTEYWVLEITAGELDDFRQFGMLPPGY